MENRTKQAKLINRAIIVSSILLVIVFIMYMGRDLLIPYTNSGYKFSMNYPANWVKVENYEGAAAVFVAPKQNSYDTFQENLSVVIQNQAENAMSLQKYTDTAIYQIKVVFKEGIQVLESESGSAYLAGKPAYKFVYVTKMAPEFKIMHVWTLDGTRAYQVTYTAAISDFDEYKNIVDKMIQSFQLLK